jgi:hypothetical protein
VKLGYPTITSKTAAEISKRYLDTLLATQDKPATGTGKKDTDHVRTSR